MKSIRRLAIGFLICCLIPLAGLAQSFTIEQVLSAPYPSNLTGAEKADRIAWVMNDEGKRNIWTAEAPVYIPVKLTDYKEDDGQALSSLTLSPDGSFLLYARGGRS